MTSDPLEKKVVMDKQLDFNSIVLDIKRQNILNRTKQKYLKIMDILLR